MKFHYYLLLLCTMSAVTFMKASDFEESHEDDLNDVDTSAPRDSSRDAEDYARNNPARSVSSKPVLSSGGVSQQLPNDVFSAVDASDTSNDRTNKGSDAAAAENATQNSLNDQMNLVKTRAMQDGLPKSLVDKLKSLFDRLFSVKTPADVFENLREAGVQKAAMEQNASALERATSGRASDRYRKAVDNAQQQYQQAMTRAVKDFYSQLPSGARSAFTSYDGSYSEELDKAFESFRKQRNRENPILTEQQLNYFFTDVKKLAQAKANSPQQSVVSTSLSGF